MPDIEDDVPKEAESGPLDESGTKTVAQQNVGKDNVIGGGEWPDPDTPPRGPSPGVAAGEAESGRRESSGQFKELLEKDPERGGSATSPTDEDPEDQ